MRFASLALGQAAAHQLELQLGVLEAALCCAQPPHEQLGDAGAIAAALTAHQVGGLFDAWTVRQEDDEVDHAWLRCELRYLMLHGSAAMIEACWSDWSETPAGYYGKPVAELTEGQLTYYAMMRSVYAELSDNEKKTESWMRKLRAEVVRERESLTSSSAARSTRSSGRARRVIGPWG